MKCLRWYILLLVLWLALFFNIEWLDIDGQTLFSMASFVRVLAVATACLFLLVPFSRRQMYAASFGVLATYAIPEALHLSAFFQGVNKYLTITEVLALLITAALAWLVRQALHDFKQAVAAITLPEAGARLLACDQFQDRLHLEMLHARRHQHPVSLTLIEIDRSSFAAVIHQAVRDAQAAVIDRYARVRFGQFLSQQIRETDTVAMCAENGRFVLLTPKTAEEQTRELLRRMSRAAEAEMGVRLRYSIADFPNTALTSEELIRSAAAKLPRAEAAGADGDSTGIAPAAEAWPAESLSNDARDGPRGGLRRGETDSGHSTG
jgi:GGDEF domain-containing protein